MGLPGSGKTTLANELGPMLNAKRLNADEVRKEANDWDFSEEGRKRQAKRMADFAIKLKSDGNYVVADFICPTPEARSLFPADYIIWVDTIKEGRFDDTNNSYKIFDFHLFFHFGFLFSRKAEIPSFASIAIILSVIILLV